MLPFEEKIWGGQRRSVPATVGRMLGQSRESLPAGSHARSWFWDDLKAPSLQR